MFKFIARMFMTILSHNFKNAGITVNTMLLVHAQCFIQHFIVHSKCVDRV